MFSGSVSAAVGACGGCGLRQLAFLLVLLDGLGVVLLLASPALLLLPAFLVLGLLLGETLGQLVLFIGQFVLVVSQHMQIVMVLPVEDASALIEFAIKLSSG